MKIFGKKDQEVKEQLPDEMGSHCRIALLGPRTKVVFSIIAISWSLFQLYTGLFGLMPAIIQRSTTVLFAFLLSFIGYSMTKKGKKTPLNHWILFLLF